MDMESFEGSIVLEMLAEHGLIEDFFEAIDSDNFSKAISLMREAQVDEQTIGITVRKMQEGQI